MLGYFHRLDYHSQFFIVPQFLLTRCWLVVPYLLAGHISPSTTIDSTITSPLVLSLELSENQQNLAAPHRLRIVHAHAPEGITDVVRALGWIRIHLVTPILRPWGAKDVEKGGAEPNDVGRIRGYVFWDCWHCHRCCCFCCLEIVMFSILTPTECGRSAAQALTTGELLNSPGPTSKLQAKWFSGTIPAFAVVS